MTTHVGEGAVAAVNSDADAERARFAADQAEMNRIWFDNLRHSGVDVDAYIAGRRAAYLDRWREAGRFIKPGARVLDIGGGYLFEELPRYFRAQNWDYWFFDVGEDIVTAARDLCAGFGYPAGQFHRGLNHELNYEDGFFDAVFSSHCIEHSMKLSETLLALNRILKPGGVLTMAVPFGWEKNPNHPYFLLEDEWLALVEDAGFRIRVFQIGCEYPEHGYDLFLAAEKAEAAPRAFRIDPENYRKDNFAFSDFRAAEIAYRGETRRLEDYTMLEAPDWRIRISPPEGVTEVLPIFIRHDWSGVVSVRCGEDFVFGDLYRQNKAAQPLRLRLSRPCETYQVVEIAPIDRHAASFGAQSVFVGYMSR